MAKVKHVLVLFESDDEERNTQILQLLKELRTAGKTVAAWGYTPKKKAINSRTIAWRMVSREDIGWFQRLKKDVRTELQNQHYDLLIDLCLTPTLPTRYMALLADADFKTGRHTTGTNYIHDFMIDLPAEKDAAFLFDQILYYLNCIKSND